MARKRSKKDRGRDTVNILRQIRQILRIIYSKDVADRIFGPLKNRMDVYTREEGIRFRTKKFGQRPIISEKDSILITYADTIYEENEKPLKTLHKFLTRYVKDTITGVHILPFFPSSSDGGFSVINYKEVDRRLGEWRDVRRISRDYHLMVDLVLNHVSSKSKWFQRFLAGDKRYRDYFIWYDSPVEMPEVFRPRETPLLTRFETAMGEKYVWTTFSADQIDLNYKNPEVLMRIIDVLLFYLSQGAVIVRLDAIGYVWKEPHTSCVNLSKTHQIVKLFRRILQYVAPYAMLLTEANFPYKDNVSYFGEGDEAHMVYQFSLPPLVLDAFVRRDTYHIQNLARRTREDLLFFDFLASHDGIGLPGARGILTEDQIKDLVDHTIKHGGFVSYMMVKGKKQPYELNITYFDAINDPKDPGDTLQVQRFMASQAIMLLLRGVPGIYIHSLLGSRNYREGVEKTGIKRMINRQKVRLEEVENSLRDNHSLRRQVLESYLRLLDSRKRIRSLHPGSKRRIVDLDKRLVSIERSYGREKILGIVNVSDEVIPLPEHELKFDLISRTLFDGQVEPYGVYALE